MADGAASKRAMGYIRVSTVRQVEEGTSITNQSESIRKYAKSNGLKIRSTDFVIDDGVSGGIPIWDRKNGRRLVKMVESGKYSHLIVTKMDRMSRLTSDAISTIDKLRKAGVGLHIIDMGGQSLDTGSSIGRFFLTVIASLAELESGIVSERTREAMQYLRKNGLRFTNAIYGWDVNGKGKFVPNWREQARIDFMSWNMRFNGISATKVAEMMNKRKLPGKMGGKWYSGSVIKVTQNRFHLRRGRFTFPEWWGQKEWHRRVPERSQRDEKVVAKVPKKVWDKGDL